VKEPAKYALSNSTVFAATSPVIRAHLSFLSVSDTFLSAKIHHSLTET